MRTIVNTCVERFLKERKEQLRLIGIIAALAVLVVTGVFWRLHHTGVAMTGEVYCGAKEHTHDEGCYEEVLVCGLEEAEPVEGHSHSDACYETVTALICGLEETPGHSHSEECYETIPARLICTLEEDPGHDHEESCCDEEGNLVCGLEEQEGHTHAEGCWSYEEQILVCTQEEYEGHTHTDACRRTETILACTLEESDPAEGHTHTEDCHEKRLVCDLEEHTHTIECMADENADLETAGIWEATLPKDLNGIWAEDVVKIAESQVGYAESTRNFILDEDEETRKGYTRYGAWYGNEYGDWDAMFASFCLHYAEVPESRFPQSSGSYAWMIALSETGDYESAADYEPLAGDLIFLDKDGDSRTECVGIVSRVKTRTGNTGEEIIEKITVIEGNCGDMVKENSYAPADSTITGYGRLPKQPGLEAESETESENDAESESECETDEETETEIETESETEEETETETETESETESETEISAEYFTGSLIFEGDDYTVTLTCDEDAEIPEKAELSVFEYEKDSAIYLDFREAADELFNGAVMPEKEDSDMDGEEEFWPETRLFHIELTAEMEQEESSEEAETEIKAETESEAATKTIIVRPAAGVQLRVSYSDQAKEAEYAVTYFAENLAEEEETSSTYKNGIQAMAFETADLGDYGIVPLADGIFTYAQLRSAINGRTGTIELFLAADMEADTNHITLSRGADITLDLNGFTLTANDTAADALFTIPTGAKMTILDGEAAPAAKGDATVVSAPDAGQPATMTENSDGSVTLTYFVTESALTNPSTGYTTETRYGCTVTSKGLITTTGRHALFSVTGGELDVDSGFLYGKTTDTNNRAIDASAGGTVNISGGYICGFYEAYGSGHGENADGGAIRVSGEGTELNISEAAVIAGNKAATGGAVDVAARAVLNMSGGIISGNEASESVGTSEANTDYGGGGIHLYNAAGNISGGYITNNLSDCSGYFDGGGGILVYGSTLNFSGGYITGNYAASSGGGIRTAFGPGPNAAAGRVNITGGSICANYAKGAEGGGVCIDNGGTCYVMAASLIYINNNETGTQVHWGGGGLFCADGATIYMKDVLITDNDAGGYGGGVAGCSTGRIAIAEGAGAAIYSNTALGAHLSGDESTKNDDHTYAEMNEIFQRYGYQDYFCALESQISGMMLGGNPSNWTGSADGEAVSNVGVNDILHAAYIMGLTAHPSEEAAAAAQSAASVYVTGNSSYTHGGGILSNGYLLIGHVEEFEIPDAMELNADKVLLNASTGEFESIEDGQFTFSVTNELDAVVSAGSVLEDGSIRFDRRLTFDAPGIYTFTIREDPAGLGTIITDTSVYTLEVTVGETFGTVTIPDQYEKVEYHFYNITHYTLYKDGERIDDQNVRSSEDSICHLTLPSYTFINYKADDISITVKKVWTDDGGWPQDVEIIYADLYCNGEAVDTVGLTAGSSSYTWENLPTLSADKETGLTYEVREQDTRGYISSQIVTNNGEESTSYWVPLSESEASEQMWAAGCQYLIVYGTGTNAVALGQRSGREDSAFGTEDSISITVNNEQLELGKETYSRYIEDETVQALTGSNIIWTAVSESRGMMLKNDNLNSWLLLQNNGGNYLKGTTGTGYASVMNFISPYLMGADGYGTTDITRYITYENLKFTSSTDPGNAVSVYVKVTPISESSSVTISNTHVEDARFTLNIRKVKEGDSNIMLPGATFQLLKKDESGEEELLYFVEITTGIYGYAEEYTDGAVTDMVTVTRGRLILTNLPMGTYVLHETAAPGGYSPAEDIEIVLNEETDRTTVYLEVEDPAYPVEIFKYATVDGEMIGLEGAEFTLSRTVTETIDEKETEVLYYAYFETVPADEKDGSDSYRLCGWATDMEDEQYSAYTFLLVSGSDGSIRITGLDIGNNYILTETKAPEGYSILKDPIPFAVTSEGAAAEGIMQSGAIGVENYQGGELPLSGGSGTIPLIAAGLLLMLGGTTLAVVRHRKRSCSKQW